jgi:PIN domain nuclease of toxin-antitoxin system
MSRFLIDTHCWLWATGNPERLSSTAAELIESEDTQVVFSTASAWEIAIKVRLGKLNLPGPVNEYVVSVLERQSIQSMPVYLHHALRVAELPLHHRDPFDRLLIAQAQIEGLPLMTADPDVAAYDVEIIWAGRGRRPRRARFARLQ